MLIKVVLAIIMPFLLVLLFTRVSYNHYVGTALAAALLIASYMKGYTHGPSIFFIDIISLAVGFFFARKMRADLLKKK